MFYFIRSPWWLRNMFPERVWKVKTNEKSIYLTFDDGPVPGITEFVLDELARYNAKASFFCIGKNAVANPDIYERILSGGHMVGNHTYDHLNGWTTPHMEYISNIVKAGEIIESRYFRPPYGKMKRFQQHLIAAKMKIIMWTLLSADFDESISPETCLNNIVLNAKPGDIIVFHDSEKAFKNLEYALPACLQYLSEKGYTFKTLRGI